MSVDGLHNSINRHGLIGREVALLQMQVVPEGGPLPKCGGSDREPNAADFQHTEILFAG